MHANQKSGLAAALLLSVWGPAAWAQTAPDAGSIQRQIEQDLKTSPVQRAQPTTKASRALSAPREGAAVLAVNRFVFEGNTRLSADQLAAIVAPYQAGQYDFDQLRQIADIVADAYRDAGWLVRVSLPKQEVKDGVVKLQIIEATFGQTIVQGRQSRVDTATLQATVEAAQATGQAVQTQSIDRALLLLDGIPGLNAVGNLVEGQQPGQTDLLLGVADRAGFNGDITLDNTGARSTGVNRMLASLSPRPFTVGLGFGTGFVDDFEPESHDVPLDAILNDNGVVWPIG